MAFGEQPDDLTDVRHGLFRSSWPARRSSSTNRWWLINFRSLSSTVSFRFSRMSVRSTSFFSSSTRRSIRPREEEGRRDRASRV
jgi:hypothetical protein